MSRVRDADTCGLCPAEDYIAALDSERRQRQRQALCQTWLMLAGFVAGLCIGFIACELLHQLAPAALPLR